MAESLHCSPEIITTLLISYTPIQIKLKKKHNIKRALQKRYVEVLTPAPQEVTLSENEVLADVNNLR